MKFPPPLLSPDGCALRFGMDANEAKMGRGQMIVPILDLARLVGRIILVYFKSAL